MEVTLWEPYPAEPKDEIDRELARIERGVRREQRMARIGKAVTATLGYLIAGLALACIAVGLLALLVVLLRVVAG